MEAVNAISEGSPLDPWRAFSIESTNAHAAARTASEAPSTSTS